MLLLLFVGLVFQVAMVTKSSASTDRSSDKKTLPSHPLLGGNTSPVVLHTIPMFPCPELENEPMAHCYRVGLRSLQVDVRDSISPYLCIHTQYSAVLLHKFPTKRSLVLKTSIVSHETL